jgi:hypothetical protein
MLLAHDSHMTVTVERFHNGHVDVRVLETNITPTHYARKIQEYGLASPPKRRRPRTRRGAVPS